MKCLPCHSALLSKSPFLFLLFLFACRSTILPAELENTRSITAQDSHKAEVLSEHQALDRDLLRLQAHSRALSEMASEMAELQSASTWSSNGYFEPREHDQIESLLFRYLLSRRALWEIVERHLQYRSHFTGQIAQTKGAILALSAGVHLSYYSSLLVDRLLDSPPAQAKLNEAYPRSGIEAGTYQMLFEQVTRTDHLQTLRIAWELFQRELQDPETPLHKIQAQGGDYGEVIQNLLAMQKKSTAQVTHILRERSLLLPELRNQLRHSVIRRAADKASKGVQGNLYAMQSVLFTLVGDTQATPAVKLHFNDDQKTKIRAALRPGDILLTFSGGYMSNIFLPGKFKHAIVYIGDVTARTQADLSPQDVGLSGWDQSETLADGTPIELIEAVSEGVVYGSLEHLFDGYITRFVVLRPQVTPAALREGLRDVFSYVGSEYDFNFDFSNGTRQCCTELVYRMLQERDGFDFRLVKRAGVFTLSADDILEHHLKSSSGRFAYVMAAVPGPPPHETPMLLHGKAEDENLFLEMMATW